MAKYFDTMAMVIDDDARKEGQYINSRASSDGGIIHHSIGAKTQALEP
jgi:hypothetical protein